MKKSIYPCLWFDNNAKEAADFYCSVFRDSKILQHSPVVTTFELCGTKFMGLNGGPRYQVNSSISYYFYCGNEEEVTRLFHALSEKGRVLMTLDKYDWSEKYAWVADRFGVNWQLDISNINSDQKIVPSMLFMDEKMSIVKEAVAHYTGIFKNSKILLESPYADNPGLLFAQFMLNDFIFNAISSSIKHEFDFSPGNSFVVECEDQQEIDHYWEKLGREGRYDMCGWLADKFGVSWQIIPAILPALMSDPEKRECVTQAFLKMQKFDIEKLINA